MQQMTCFDNEDMQLLTNNSNNINNIKLVDNKTKQKYK